MEIWSAAIGEEEEREWSEVIRLSFFGPNDYLCVYIVVNNIGHAFNLDIKKIGIFFWRG